MAGGPGGPEESRLAWGTGIPRERGQPLLALPATARQKALRLPGSDGETAKESGISFCETKLK